MSVLPDHGCACGGGLRAVTAAPSTEPCRSSSPEAAGRATGASPCSPIAVPSPAQILRNLPIPPSVNMLFANASKGRRRTPVYNTWRNAAGWAVRAQRPLKICGPVALVYTIENGASRADLGNHEKGVTDLLVDLDLIDGDGPKTVRSIKLQWGSRPGLTVEIWSHQE